MGSDCRLVFVMQVTGHTICPTMSAIRQHVAVLGMAMLSGGQFVCLSVSQSAVTRWSGLRETWASAVLCVFILISKLNVVNTLLG